MGRKPKQQTFEELQQEPIPEVDDACKAYYSAMTKRQKLSDVEKATKAELIEKLMTHGVDCYEYDGMFVKLVSKAGVKFVDKEDGESESEDEESEE